MSVWKKEKKVSIKPEGEKVVSTPVGIKRKTLGYINTLKNDVCKSQMSTSQRLVAIIYDYVGEDWK